MALPVWMQSRLDESDLAAIEAAVARGESKTSGEIVPMIVRSSSYAGHVPLTIALLVFAFLSLFVPLFTEHSTIPSVYWDVGIFVLSLFAAFILSHVTAIRRALVPWPDQHSAVARRAQLEFYTTGIPATEGHTGVLIFISLFERRAIVLGDDVISARLNQETWVAVVSEMLHKFGNGSMRDGLVVAIEKVGEILAREFPIKPGDVNELPNALVIKE